MLTSKNIESDERIFVFIIRFGFVKDRNITMEGIVYLEKDLFKR